jgi:hypothetical protein
MERTYESAAALVERAAGPLEPHLIVFVRSLIAQQYTASVVYIKALHAVAFDRWLAKRRVGLADLGEGHLQRYGHRRRRRQQCIRPETRRIEWCAVMQLLQFLRDRGLCPAARVQTTAAEKLVSSFQQHLRDQQGLATATIERYTTVASQFLDEHFGNGAVDLRTLCANDGIAFIQRQARRMEPPCICC